MPITRADIEAAHARMAPASAALGPELGNAFGHDGPVSLARIPAARGLVQNARRLQHAAEGSACRRRHAPQAAITVRRWHAAKHQVKARIFVPEISRPAKIAVIRSHGAEVVIGGARYADAQAACDLYVEESGALRVHPFGVESTVIGQGTAALEWEQDAPALNTVLVAVGGGGLISGVSSWAGRVRSGGRRARRLARARACARGGRPVDVDVDPVAADSLGEELSDLVYSICTADDDRSRGARH